MVAVLLQFKNAAPAKQWDICITHENYTSFRLQNWNKFFWTVTGLNKEKIFNSNWVDLSLVKIRLKTSSSKIQYEKKRKEKYFHANSVVILVLTI